MSKAGQISDCFSNRSAAGEEAEFFEAMFVAFDILYFDDHDLTGMDLMARRHLLESLIPSGDEGVIRPSEEIEADGGKLLAFSAQPRVRLVDDVCLLKKVREAFQVSL